MNLRIAALLVLTVSCCAAAGSTADQLAREAGKAEHEGHLVRAYFLYAQASAEEPKNAVYRDKRDLLAPLAQILTKPTVQKAASTPPLQIHGPAPLHEVWNTAPNPGSALKGLPQLHASPAVHDFHLRGDTKALFAQVAGAYGIQVLFDPAMQPQPNLRFDIGHAGFRTAMLGLTDATDTFLFPVNTHTIFVARDTTAKRSEYEPDISLTIPLPEAIDQKHLIQAANAVRSALGLQSMAWDSVNHTVQIRGPVTRVKIARGLLEALLLPKGQVSIGVEFLTLDKERNYHYGLSLPTAFNLIDLGHLGHFQSLISIPSGITNAFAFGGGATLFGVGLTNGALFAQYTKSIATNLYHATVVVADGQTADFHIGDKYPIPQSIYTGFQQSGLPGIYNPIGQVTLVDLGLKLKISPRIHGDGDISLKIDAQYSALGTQTYNTIPAIAQRTYQGTVRLRQGEWAVLAGLDQKTHSVTRSGLIGLAQVPGLNQVLSENTRDTQTGQTLIVIKPTITRLPMTSWISPQYLLGPRGGSRVLL